MKYYRRRISIPLLLLLIWLCTSAVKGQTSGEVFNLYCKGCHTIGGGPLIGPDLKNVSQRQERDWLVRWLIDPVGMLQAKDPYALKLQKESRGAIMPPTPGMNKALADALLDFIERESEKEGSEFAGPDLAKKSELTVEHAKRGRDYFYGWLSFKNGAPACIGCHTHNGIPGILGGGGRLGPDLSDAYTRLGERRGLAVWLAAPPQPTMNPVFKQHPLEEQEVLALVAYLKSEAGSGNKTNAASMGNFFIISLLLATSLFVLFGLLWSNRFKGIRIKMIRDRYSSSID